MTKTDRDALLNNVAQQAYMLGLSDAPSVMGKRGRAVQIEGGRTTSDGIFIKSLIDWESFKKRLTRSVDFTFDGIPPEEM